MSGKGNCYDNASVETLLPPFGRCLRPKSLKAELIWRQSWPTPARLLGWYIVGAPRARLDAQGLKIRFLEEVVSIEENAVVVAHVYSQRQSRLELHLMGDAFAPRRRVFATRQAHALALERFSI